MKLDDEDIREFAKLWQEEFGEPLAMDEARHRAALLLEFHSVLDRSKRNASLSLPEPEVHHPSP
jgi:hypothetical protein